MGRRTCWCFELFCHHCTQVSAAVAIFYVCISCLHGAHICRLDALAVALHEDFGSRSKHLDDRQMRFAAFVGAHPSADVRIFGDHYICARDCAEEAEAEAEDDAAGGSPDEDVQDM